MMIYHIGKIIIDLDFMFKKLGVIYIKKPNSLNMNLKNLYQEFNKLFPIELYKV